MAGGKYHQFGVREGVICQFQRLANLPDNAVLYLQVNIDGLPLFKSSSESFWPILGLLKLAHCMMEPFIIGLWVGNSKPHDANQYLQCFVDEMKEIQLNGFMYRGRTYHINILNIVCDTPARAFTKKIKGHTGYYGCDNCTQRGLWTDHRITFPERGATSRTDVAFHDMLYEIINMDSQFCLN